MNDQWIHKQDAHKYATRVKLLAGFALEGLRKNWKKYRRDKEAYLVMERDLLWLQTEALDFLKSLQIKEQQ